MKALYELKDKFEMELEELAREEDGGYSEAGDWEGRGSYNRGSSYANRGKHYVRGHYSRDGYSNRGRESGYSRHDAKEQMMAQLEDMMGSVSNEREREAIRRCMEQLDRE